MLLQSDRPFFGKTLSQGISMTERRTHGRYSSQWCNLFQIAYIQSNIRGMKTRADLKKISCLNKNDTECTYSRVQNLVFCPTN